MRKCPSLNMYLANFSSTGCIMSLWHLLVSAMAEFLHWDREVNSGSYVLMLTPYLLSHQLSHFIIHFPKGLVRSISF